MKKMCSCCKVEKLFSEFAKRSIAKDGLQNQCKQCKFVSLKQWRAENPDSVRHHNATNYQRNTDTIKASVKRWKANNPERARELDRIKEARKPDLKRARVAKRRVAMRTSVPLWADLDAVKGMYQLAQIFRSVGLNIHVDHIVPVRGKTVSGLHTHDNLQLLLGSKNIGKGNRVWPDMP